LSTLNSGLRQTVFGRSNKRHGETMKQWTFITHHAAVLVLMANHPRITARELAQEVGVTERTIRMIISDLEAGGYIQKVREGRGVQYRVYPQSPLRHEVLQGTVVGKLLEVLGWRTPCGEMTATADFKP
jgi:predicted DNA-binding transcriptional regulator YafY